MSALRNTEALAEAVALVEKHAGCGDNSCLFVKPQGMATNGGCRCVDRGGGRPFVQQALAKLFKEAKEFLRAAAEPEAKAPVCDHGRPPTRMVPCLKVDGAWACETCGSQCYDPENPSKAARPEAKCMGMIPGTAFMCGEMAGYYCPNCRREDDR